MINYYSYKNCYKILGLQNDCTWADARQSYKKLILKWHPDRFTDNPKEKAAATDKIKTINIAHQHLSTYYRENNSLPQVNSPNKPTRQKPSPPRSQQEKYKSTSVAKPGSFPIIKAGLLIAALAGAYFILAKAPPSPETHIPYTSKSLETNLIKQSETHFTTPQNSNTSDKTSLVSNSDIEPKNNIFFTNGSSMGDVVMIQGVPTKTEQNIWYYGKSEIHFYEGKVTHWTRTKEHPLKAQLKLNN